MERVVEKSISELQAENAKQQQTIDRLNKTIQLLKEKVDYLIRHRFAPKSEQFPLDQQSLFELEASDKVPDEPPPSDPPSRKRKKGGRRKPPKHLPRECVEHDLSDEDKRCQCGASRARIGEQVSEQYDVLPATFRVLEHVRFVYACPKCDAAPKTAKQFPPAPLPRTQASPGILAWIWAGTMSMACH